MLRLFAPFLPFATEEVWSWTHEGSVHRAEWPSASSLVADDAQPAGMLAAVGAALIGIRRAKTDAKVSQKTEVASAVLSAPPTQLALIRQAADDLRAVGRISTLTFAEGDEIAISDVVFTEQVD
jgi:valyl-tRNA synthetase